VTQTLPQMNQTCSHLLLRSCPFLPSCLPVTSGQGLALRSWSRNLLLGAWHLRKTAQLLYGAKADFCWRRWTGAEASVLPRQQAANSELVRTWGI
jgi:hypothetical protein